MIKYSVERLYHFLCEKCKKWWTVGDWKLKEIMYCPHCGQFQDVEEIKVED